MVDLNFDDFEIPTERGTTTPRQGSNIETIRKGDYETPTTFDVQAVPYDQGGLPQSADEKAGRGEFARTVNQLLYGANEYILALPDMAINAFLDAKGLATGDPVENKNLLTRLFNSGDYETVRTIIPGLLTFGEGQKVGPQGALQQVARSAGEGLGIGTLFGAGTLSAGANIAARGIGPEVAVGAGTLRAPADKIVKDLTSDIPTQGVKNTSIKIPFKKEAVEIPRGIVSKSILGDAIKNPGRVAAIETGFGTASGGLMEVGGDTAEIVGAPREIGEVIGALSPIALVGATAKTVNLAGKAIDASPTKKVIDFTKNIIRKGTDLTKGVTSPVTKMSADDVAGSQTKEVQQVKKGVGEAFGKAFESPKVREEVAKAEKAEELLQPFAEKGGDEPITFSPGEQTKDKIIMETERKILSKAGEDTARDNEARIQNIKNAGKRFIEDKFSTNVNDTPNYIVDEQYKINNGMIETNNVKINEINDKIEMLRTDGVTEVNKKEFKLPTTESKAAEGLRLRQSIVRAQEEADNAVKAKAEELGINTVDPLRKTGLQDIQTKFIDTLGTKTGLTATSNSKTVNDFIKYDFKEKGLSFQDWKKFREDVQTDLTKANARSDNRQKRDLAALIKVLDDEIAPLFGGTAKNFDQFLDFYKTTKLQPFNNAVAVKVLRPDVGFTKQTPVYKTAPEHLMKEFIKDTNTAQQWNKIFGGMDKNSADYKSELELIRRAISDEIRQKSGLNLQKGTFKPEQIQKYINDKADMLKEFGLFDEFNTTSKAINKMQERLVSLKNRNKRINTNLMYRKIASAYNNDNPEQVVEKALTKPKLLDRLIKDVKKISIKEDNPELFKEFQGVLVNKLLTQSRTGAGAPEAASGTMAGADPQKFLAYLVGYEKPLTKVLGKQHYDDLLTVGDAFLRANIYSGVRGRGKEFEGFLNKVASEIGTTIPSISTRLIAIGENRIGAKSSAAWFLSRAISSRQQQLMDKLFEKAIFDKDIAKDLAKQHESLTDETLEAGTAIIPKDEINRIKGYLFQMGVPGELIPSKEPDQGKIEFDPLGAAPTEDTGVQIAAAPNRMPPIPPVTPDMIPQSNVPVQQMGQSGMASVKPSAQELFPFDPTSAAIARRTTPQRSGIASLV
jgi:hypothetical protein